MEERISSIYVVNFPIKFNMVFSLTSSQFEGYDLPCVISKYDKLMIDYRFGSGAGLGLSNISLGI